MLNPFFYALESIDDRQAADLNACIEHLAFDRDGLLPVVVQCHASGKVLMLAWMNRDAIHRTLASGRMTYWSRSRQAFWVKGETSGNIQTLKAMHFDCDGDALLCVVEQTGGACHTGRPGCFYLQVDAGAKQVRLHQQAGAGY